MNDKCEYDVSEYDVSIFFCWTREKMDRIIVTHIVILQEKSPSEKEHARALFLSYEITQPPSSDGPRTRVNLSLSLSFSFARAVRSKERW